MQAAPTSGLPLLQRSTTASRLATSRAHRLLRTILQQTFKYGNPNTIIKTAVALQGHNVGKCRAPFNYVPEEGLEAIKKVLAENEAKGLH